MTVFAELIRLVDDLESRAASYVTLPEIEAAGATPIDAAIAASVLLVDQRTRLDRSSGQFEPVTLCRLNRQHPVVKKLTGW